MKIIETKERGGDVVKEDGGFFGGRLFEFPKAGETRRKTRETTHEGILQIPFNVCYDETLAPALDINGKPKEETEPGRVTDLWIELPFDCYGGKGTVKFHASGYSIGLDENQLGNAILRALGNEILSYKIPQKT